jgi:hypothetical protein
MPFDGTDFVVTNIAAAEPDRGGIAGMRNWLRSRFCPGLRPGIDDASAPSLPIDRNEAVARLLLDAKALIADPDHWLQGKYQWFRGRRCAIGALRAAARRLNDRSLTWSAHALLIRVANDRRFTTVEGMNDHSSHGEVLRAFDEAVAMARAGQ